MRTKVEVKLSDRGPWVLAELTDERLYGHAVIVVEGEHAARGPMEVACVRPVTGTDIDQLDAAQRAGFLVDMHHAT